jgi:hypothetical protein
MTLLALVLLVLVALLSWAARGSSRDREGRIPPARAPPPWGAFASAPSAREVRCLCLAALAALAAFAAFGRVLSPQFMTWVMPLFGLALAWRMYALAAASGLACALTLAEFPSRYFDLVARDDGAVVIVALRDLALLVAVALAARAALAVSPRPAPAAG